MFNSIKKTLSVITLIVTASLSIAQSPNSLSYSRANQTNSMLIAKNTESNLNYLKQQSNVDWNNQRQITDLNNTANQTFAIQNGIKYEETGYSTFNLRNALELQGIKTSVYNTIFQKVNQLIATSDSYKSFSEEGLLPLRNSPEYNSLSEDQKTNMDNFLCSIDNFVYFAETLIPKTILDPGPQSGGPSFDGESYLKAAWPKWLRCAAGIVGGALLGGLEGASAGSVVPVIGTVGGGIIGIIGGGLVGGAAAC